MLWTKSVLLLNEILNPLLFANTGKVKASFPLEQAEELERIYQAVETWRSTMMLKLKQTGGKGQLVYPITQKSKELIGEEDPRGEILFNSDYWGLLGEREQAGSLDWEEAYSLIK